MHSVEYTLYTHGLHGQTEDIDYTAHGSVLPPHSAASVHLAVPVAGGGQGEAGAGLLQEDAGDNVLVGLL